MKTSIIVLSYNRKDLVERCLAAIFKNAPPGTEVIMVDNASTENIPGLVKKQFPEAKLMALKENLGFAAGNNLGMRAGGGEYFLLLNSDAFLEKDTVPKLLEFVKNHPDAGVVGPQLLNADGTLQPSAGYFPHLWQVFLMMTVLDNLPILKKFAPSIHVRDAGAFSEPRTFSWVTGACLLIPRPVFEKTKGFDENYFMYGEELEWQYRMQKMGYKSYYLPTARITHLGFSSSSPANGAIKELQSFVAFYKKYKPGWQIPVLKLFIIFGCILRICRGLIQSKHRWMMKAYSTVLTR